MPNGRPEPRGPGLEKGTSGLVPRRLEALVGLHMLSIQLTTVVLEEEVLVGQVGEGFAHVPTESEEYNLHTELVLAQLRRRRHVLVPGGKHNSLHIAKRSLPYGMAREIHIRPALPVVAGIGVPAHRLKACDHPLLLHRVVELL